MICSKEFVNSNGGHVEKKLLKIKKVTKNQLKLIELSVLTE